MITAVANSTDNAVAPNAKTNQQAWRSQLLGVMGVGRWVGQRVPVMLTTWQDTPAIDQHLPVNEPLNDTTTSTQTAVNLANVNPNPSLIPPTKREILTPSNANEPPIHQMVNSLPQVLVKRFSLQAVMWQDWVLLVDGAILQQDPRQALLWQQITMSLGLTMVQFDFPLVDNEAQLPLRTLQLMSSQQMALAGFAGFLHQLTQGRPRAQLKLAHLTPVSDCLDTLKLQQLPYLSDMLVDFRKKRQLWQTLTMI